MAQRVIARKLQDCNQSDCDCKKQMQFGPEGVQCEPCEKPVDMCRLCVLFALMLCGVPLALTRATQAYLNGIDVPGIFFFSTLVAKLAGSVGAVAGGLAIGKEGPFVHAGACIAALLSQVRGSWGRGGCNV